MPRYRLADGQQIIADADWIAANYPLAELIVEVIEYVPAPLTVQEFRDRFTDAEKANIHAAALESGAMAAWLADLAAAPCVRLYNARTIAGVQYLESVGLIDEGRAAVILTP